MKPQFNINETKGWRVTLYQKAGKGRPPVIDKNFYMLTVKGSYNIPFDASNLQLTLDRMFPKVKCTYEEVEGDTFRLLLSSNRVIKRSKKLCLAAHAIDDFWRWRDGHDTSPKLYDLYGLKKRAKLAMKKAKWFHKLPSDEKIN